MKTNLESQAARVLILAPTVRDSETTARILASRGIGSVLCEDMRDVCREIAHGADAAILTEESVLSDGPGELRHLLENQPIWSDFPLILLTPSGRESRFVQELEAIGNMTFVSRPLQIAVLLSTVRSAFGATGGGNTPSANTCSSATGRSRRWSKRATPPKPPTSPKRNSWPI